MSYPFRQGLDYGKRKGTLGLAFHMSEGSDGLVGYLAQHAGETRAQWIERIRGVSANACILSDGTVWQMVAWANASGSMNPSDRGPATGYYNTKVIQAVLGPGWTDPNTWSISCEIAGRRINGPTDAQVAAAVRWGNDMASRFATLRGAFGHADQTSTKGCPGLTPNMRSIFDQLGGHGLWAEEADMPGVRWQFADAARSGWATVKGDDHLYLNLSTGTTHGIPDGSRKRALGPASLVDRGITGPTDTRRSGFVINQEAAFVLADDVVWEPDPATDDTVHAELERAADRAHDAVLAQ